MCRYSDIKQAQCKKGDCATSNDSSLAKVFCEQHINQHETHGNEYVMTNKENVIDLSHYVDDMEFTEDHYDEIQSIVNSIHYIDTDIPRNDILSYEQTKSGMIMFEKDKTIILNDEGRQSYFKVFAKDFVELEGQKINIKQRLQSNFISLLKNNIKVIIPADTENINTEFCVLTVIKNIFDEIETVATNDYINKQSKTLKEKNDFCKHLYEERYHTINDFIYMCYKIHIDKDIYVMKFLSQNRGRTKMVFKMITCIFQNNLKLKHLMAQ
jgi:hypothetical protein